MSRPQLIAGVVLAILAVYVGASTLVRMHEGRCFAGGRRGGLDCTFPARPAVHLAR